MASGRPPFLPSFLSAVCVCVCVVCLVSCLGGPAIPAREGRACQHGPQDHRQGDVGAADTRQAQEGRQDLDHQSTKILEKGRRVESGGCCCNIPVRKTEGERPRDGGGSERGRQSGGGVYCRGQQAKAEVIVFAREICRRDFLLGACPPPPKSRAPDCRSGGVLRGNGGEAVGDRGRVKSLL